jgi:hypothetical protein
MLVDNDIVISEISDTLGIELKDILVSRLEEERAELYSGFLPSDDYWFHSVLGTDSLDGERKEVVVAVSSSSSQVIVPTVDCQITFEDLSLSQCPEYKFQDDPVWRIAKLSLLALDDFKQKKFRLWEHQINEPECEAAFRRLLQQGPIRNVFDKFIFPSSEEVACNYKVVDEHSGKTVDVPHQVSQMRIWNPVTRVYDNLDCSLVGAPKSDVEAELYWNNKLAQLRELRGSQYIDSLLVAKH